MTANPMREKNSRNDQHQGRHLEEKQNKKDMNLGRLWYRYIAASHTGTYGITFEYLLII